jgi:hypothetical protein
MRTAREVLSYAVSVLVVVLAGCEAQDVSFARLGPPARSAELSAYEDFVGSWEWEAYLLDKEGKAKGEAWEGTAEWKWTLDQRCLHGQMMVKGPDIEFEAEGIWSWHPKNKKYIWWMFNNWGYPQQGTAKYDAERKFWKMPYTSVGLDGTTSYGEYTMTVENRDTLKWTMIEWGDMTRMLVKKMAMEGTYTRKR